MARNLIFSRGSAVPELVNQLLAALASSVPRPIQALLRHTQSDLGTFLAQGLWISSGLFQAPGRSMRSRDGHARLMSARRDAHVAQCNRRQSECFACGTPIALCAGGL